MFIDMRVTQTDTNLGIRRNRVHSLFHAVVSFQEFSTSASSKDSSGKGIRNALAWKHKIGLSSFHKRGAQSTI